MNIYFLAGASGSGKTSIMPALKGALSEEIAVCDFDDIGVPEGADKKWRQESTEKWLQILLRENKDTCFLGQIVLGELLACPSAKHINKINFCLLDVSDYERIQRLKKRGTSVADQNTLNWAAWLRMHMFDPSWQQHVIKGNCWNGLRWNAWDNLDTWNQKANTKIIDTTGLSLIEVSAKVTDWINEIKGRT